MSVILRPGSQRLVAPGLTMSAGLAVLASIAQLGIRGARLKWPNDLLLEEAKLAGILIESRSQDGSPADYVVGIGINVGQRTFPDELLDERPVTSLALAGHDLAPADLVAPIALALEERLSLLVQDPMACCRDYLQATGLRDARCEVELGQATYQGVLLDLNLSSGLRLKLESGRTQHLALEHVRALRRVPKGPE